MTTATLTREIIYDRSTKDFAAYLDDEYIGSYKTYIDAESTLNNLYLDLITSGICHTASELDGGIPDDEPLPYPLPDDADPPSVYRKEGIL